ARSGVRPGARAVGRAARVRVRAQGRRRGDVLRGEAEGPAMKKVLIVDDSPSVRKEVSQALSRAGYEVVEAVDGADGIAKIDQQPPAAVICSVNMPRMNGLDMLEAIRREPQHARLPVVMLTSEGQPALIERARKAGARGWLMKPFRTDLLVAAVG